MDVRERSRVIQRVVRVRTTEERNGLLGDQQCDREESWETRKQKGKQRPAEGGARNTSRGTQEDVNDSIETQRDISGSK